MKLTSSLTAGINIIIIIIIIITATIVRQHAIYAERDIVLPILSVRPSVSQAV